MSEPSGYPQIPNWPSRYHYDIYRRAPYRYRQPNEVLVGVASLRLGASSCWKPSAWELPVQAAARHLSGVPAGPQLRAVVRHRTRAPARLPGGPPWLVRRPSRSIWDLLRFGVFEFFRKRQPFCLHLEEVHANTSGGTCHDYSSATVYPAEFRASRKLFSRVLYLEPPVYIFFTVPRAFRKLFSRVLDLEPWFCFLASALGPKPWSVEHPVAWRILHMSRPDAER